MSACGVDAIQATGRTVAAVLLLAGGLQALQAASIAAALPVNFVMVLMVFGFIKSLAEDSSAVP